jgi:hypothetical protein
MFGGLLLTRGATQWPGYVLLFGGAALLVGSLYAWLTSPLEPEHAH